MLTPPNVIIIIMVITVCEFVTREQQLYSCSHTSIVIADKENIETADHLSGFYKLVPSFSFSCRLTTDVLTYVQVYLNHFITGRRTYYYLLLQLPKLQHQYYSQLPFIINSICLLLHLNSVLRLKMFSKVCKNIINQGARQYSSKVINYILYYDTYYTFEIIQLL